MKAGSVALLAAVILAAGCASDAAEGPGSLLRSRKATTADRKCAAVPACQAYMQKLRQRIYDSWSGGTALPAGTVLIGLKLDATGNASAVRTLGATDEELGRSARSAVAYASPFGLLPAGLAFLDNEPITLELSLPPAVGGGARKSVKPKP
jgi:hypothetical protein